MKLISHTQIHTQRANAFTLRYCCLIFIYFIFASKGIEVEIKITVQFILSWWEVYFIEYYSGIILSSYIAAISSFTMIN